MTPRPSVVIRRHRLRQVTLDDLVDAGHPVRRSAASFLSAAVKARKSIVVAGAAGSREDHLGAGAVRGDPQARGDRHLRDRVRAAPARAARAAPDRASRGRPGPGPASAAPTAGRPASSPCDEALFDSFRFNLSRQIVGEVRGHEILAMLKAMESGAGSISTTHAANAEGAIGKLVTCAMEAGPHVTHDYAVRAIAADHRHRRPRPPGHHARSRRHLRSATGGSPRSSPSPRGEREKGYAIHPRLRAPRTGGSGSATPDVLPDDYRDLSRYGFDLRRATCRSGTGRVMTAADPRRRPAPSSSPA